MRRRLTALLLALALILALTDSFAALGEETGYEPLGSNVSVGKKVDFGAFEQDGNSANGKEALKWTVIDVQDGRALLLSDKIIYASAFSSESTVTWEGSGAREWLNDAFLSSAFSEKEQSAIALTLVDNSDTMGNPIWTAHNWNDTVDSVFLLSYAEILNYLGNNFTCEATAYAKGLRLGSGKNAAWWLRSGGFSSASAAAIDASGNCVSLKAAGNICGLRPAMWVMLSVDPTAAPDDGQKLMQTVKKTEVNYDYVMVLDVSGSMEGQPISAVKTASESLIEGIYANSPSSQIELIKYSTYTNVVKGFTPSSQEYSLKSAVSSLYANGNTIMSSALTKTEETCRLRWQQLRNSGKNTSNARICVIFMSDGVPTEDVIYVYDAADKLHALEYVDVYCVGFFHNIYGGDRKTCENLLRYIASDSSKLFIVDMASDLKLTLSDIISTITGNAPILIRIDFVGDVWVVYNGERLDKNNRRTSFGTMQFEGANDSVKVIRLRASLDYEIYFSPTTDELIDISVYIPDINGAYTDERSIIGLKAFVGYEYRISITLTEVRVWAYDDSGALTYWILEAHVTITITVHYRSISWYTSLFLIRTSSEFTYNIADVSGRCAFDGNLSTAWCEGANGDGVGEWIMASTLDGRKYTLRRVEIVTGYTKSDWHWDLNSRVAAFDLYVDGVFIERLELKDVKTRQYFTLSEPVSGSEFKFVIAKVYRGSENINGKSARLPDTLVTEIALK